MDFNFMEWTQERHGGLPWLAGPDEHEERYKDVPLVVAPGQEEAYLQSLKKGNETGTVKSEQTMQPKKKQKETVENENREVVAPANPIRMNEQAIQGTEGNGWDKLLGTLGLEGMGDITGNLGYVMAMLPDVLLGIFTGKTKSLRPGDNLLPIASIVAGMFVRNPLLKMLLMGLGGMNLLNKAGHEALQGRTEGKINANANNGNDVQYRRYADEPLNPRIVNPVLQGGTLIVTIDRIPCTIQLSPTVAAAYRAGALPLNTLANAVLAQERPDSSDCRTEL